MHLLIPFAYCSAEACRLALPSLQLPNLKKLLCRLTPEPPDQGEATSLSPPHERALARILGLPVADGLIPWAAWQARRPHPNPLPEGEGEETNYFHSPGDEARSEADSAWAFITPCHWQAGAKHAAMDAAELVDFPALESQTLLSAMRPYFEEDGIALHYQQPSRWLARGAAFKGLATASLDRVAGRDVASWLPSSGRAIMLQRLQSEMQMLLHNHPINDARIARGAPTVNSFWISGTGPHPCPLPAGEGANAPTVINTLRQAALAEDWSGWASAWQATDAVECQTLLSAQARGESVQLTLCGERSAQTWVTRAQSFRQRVMSFFGSQAASVVLERL